MVYENNRVKMTKFGDGGLMGLIARRMVWMLAALWLLAGHVEAVTPKVAAGDAHSVMLKNDGTVVAFGNDGSGQLGQGRLLSSSTPLQVPGLASVRQVAVQNHSVALGQDGRVWTWGNNNSGQLGDGSTTNRGTPAPVATLTNVISIAAGSNHTVVLKQDGTVWAWGDNAFGQVGDGSMTFVWSSPVQVANLTNVTAIAAGANHTLALKQDGTVWTWGWNNFGQLGDSTTTFLRRAPVQVALTNVAAIAAGWDHTLALKQDGTVWTWGWNNFGQLGDGTKTNRSTPAQVANLIGVSVIAAGYAHTLALKLDGTVWGWGANGGLLGDGTTTDRSSPVQAANLSNVTAVSAGMWHTRALKQDGTAWARGYNGDGQLGVGTATLQVTPVQVTKMNNVSAIAAGANHSAAARQDGTVWAWGSNNYGQLGEGTATQRSTPVPVADFTNVSAVAAGAAHSLALKLDGSIWGWGDNHVGQLGDGTTTSRNTPVQVANFTDGSAIAAGYTHSLALKRDDTVWAWGYNYFGQLGDGTTIYRYTPVQVVSLAGVSAVVAGESHSLAMKRDGTVWAWGRNQFGQLGDGTTIDRRTPVQVANLTNVTAIAAGYRHSLALKQDGTVWAWGNNFFGELGDGTETNRSTPVQVTNISNMSGIAAGSEHSIALKQDGSVWAWGLNNDGELGDGTSLRRVTQVQVVNLSNAIAIAAGGNRSIALKQDGTVPTWGGNRSGVLGDGTFAQRRSPVLVVNPSVSGFLNLNSDAAIIAPPELQVPFFVSATGSITDTSATVITTINFNAPAFDKSGTAPSASASTAKFTAADADTLGSVYVTGWVPRAALAALGIPSADGSLIVTRTTDNPNLVSAALLHISQGTLAATDASSFVLVQKTAAGWQLVVNGQLIPYATGVLNDQLAAQKILDGTDTTNLKGAVFCLGYGTSAPEMTASGRMRAVATIPDPNSSTAVSVSCLVQGVPLALKNYSDSWWNANESGWGITITDHGSNAFVQWYAYDQFGHNQKYVISGGTFSADKCLFSGAISHVTGPSWTSPTFDPNLVARSTAGTGTIDFCPTGLATGTIVFNYTADGVTGSKQLTRLSFGNDVPHLAGTANTGAADFTDLWYNPAESGWGVSVTQHGNNIFFRVFVYDTDGRPLLFIVPGVTFNSATSFTGALTLTTGPYFGATPFDPNQVVRTTAGTATLTFADANNGTLTYTVGSVTKTKAITRLVF